MSLTGKFDQHRRRKTGKINPEKSSEESEVENFVRSGYIRNLSFVLSDGTRQFFNYADLTSCAYIPDECKIIINYRGFYTVTLTGRNLEKLYASLRTQVPKEIVCMDKRYESTTKENEILITEILITEIRI